uniref:Putative secreted protein n=1 Tax=Anopheles marajoara TaxID=58244 RepID=A0A2M4C7S1_9DIPT
MPPERPRGFLEAAAAAAAATAAGACGVRQLSVAMTPSKERMGEGAYSDVSIVCVPMRSLSLALFLTLSHVLHTINALVTRWRLLHGLSPWMRHTYRDGSRSPMMNAHNAGNQ